MSRTSIIICVMTAFMLSVMTASAAPMSTDAYFDAPVEVQLTTTSFEMHNNSDADGGDHGEKDPIFTPMQVAIHDHGIDINVYYMASDNGTDDADNNDDDDTGDVNVTGPVLLNMGLSTPMDAQMNEVYMGNVHMCANDSDDSVDDDDPTDPDNNGTDPNQKDPVFVPSSVAVNDLVSYNHLIRD